MGILYARSVLVKIKLDFKVYLTLVMNVFKSTDSSTDDKQLLIRKFTLIHTVLVILAPDWFNTKQITVKIFGLEIVITMRCSGRIKGKLKHVRVKIHKVYT